MMPARGKCWDAGTELWVPGRGWRPLLGSLKSSLCPGDALKEPTVGGRCSACPPTPMGPVLPLSLLVVPLVGWSRCLGLEEMRQRPDRLHRVVALPCPLPCGKNASC